VAYEPSGIVVFDIDSKHGADPREVLDEHDVNGSPVVLTGEAPEPGEKHPNSLAGVRGVQAFFEGSAPTVKLKRIPGTELRGVGHIVVPPSVHPSGFEYLGELPPVDQLPPLPDWLRELASETRTNGMAADP
jgi:bifunctional DNA primase/polymerase-like protein